MKMDSQNPGGEGALDKSMKGCERYQAQGKGDLQAGYAPDSMKKFDLSAGGSLGGSMGGSNQKSGHALKSFSGSTVTGSSKAAK